MRLSEMSKRINRAKILIYQTLNSLLSKTLLILSAPLFFFRNLHLHILAQLKIVMALEPLR